MGYLYVLLILYGTSKLILRNEDLLNIINEERRLNWVLKPPYARERRRFADEHR